MLTWASPHPDAIDWQHRATANGGLTHNLHRDAASRLCKGLDSAGLASEIIEIYAFLGDNVPAVCTKLFYSAVGSNQLANSSNWLDSNIVAFGGLKDPANTSKRILTSMVISTALAGKESVAGVHWYTRDTATGGSQVVFGNSSVAGGAGFLCGWVSSGTRDSGAVAASTNYAVGASPSVAGFQGASNLSSRQTQFFLNGVATGAVGTASSGTWLTANTLLIGVNGSTSFWKRDDLYGDVTVGMTAADELRLSQVVTSFQRFLNRA